MAGGRRRSQRPKTAGGQRGDWRRACDPEAAGGVTAEVRRAGRHGPTRAGKLGRPAPFETMREVRAARMRRSSIGDADRAPPARGTSRGRRQAALGRGEPQPEEAAGAGRAGRGRCRGDGLTHGAEPLHPRAMDGSRKPSVSSPRSPSLGAGDGAHTTTKRSTGHPPSRSATAYGAGMQKRFGLGGTRWRPTGGPPPRQRRSHRYRAGTRFASQVDERHLEPPRRAPRPVALVVHDDHQRGVAVTGTRQRDGVPG